MAEVKLEKTPCDRELIEKILAILEKHEKLLPQFLSDKHTTMIFTNYLR